MINLIEKVFPTIPFHRIEALLKRIWFYIRTRILYEHTRAVFPRTKREYSGKGAILVSTCIRQRFQTKCYKIRILIV